MFSTMQRLLTAFQLGGPDPTSCIRRRLLCRSAHLCPGSASGFGSQLDRGLSRYLREVGQIVGVRLLNKQKGSLTRSGQVFPEAHQPCNLGWMLRKARDPGQVVGFLKHFDNLLKELLKSSPLISKSGNKLIWMSSTGKRCHRPSSLLAFDFRYWLYLFLISCRLPSSSPCLTCWQVSGFHFFILTPTYKTGRLVTWSINSLC